MLSAGLLVRVRRAGLRLQLLCDPLTRHQPRPADFDLRSVIERCNGLGLLCAMDCHDGLSHPVWVDIVADAVVVHAALSQFGYALLFHHML